MKNEQGLKKYLKYIVAVIVVFILWELSSRIINMNFFPGSFTSFADFFVLLFDGTLIPHVIASAYRIITGILFGFVFSMIVGLIMGLNKNADKILSPIFVILYPIPKVVFLPVFVVMLGIGDLPKITLIAIVLFFQLTVAIRDGVKNIPENMSLIMRSMNPNLFKYLSHLVIPAVMPEIFTALKSTIGISVAMLFITETFASTRGLGYYILRMMDSRNYTDMFAGIIALGVLGTLLYGVLEIMQNNICKWKTY